MLPSKEGSYEHASDLMVLQVPAAIHIDIPALDEHLRHRYSMCAFPTRQIVLLFEALLLSEL